MQKKSKTDASLTRIVDANCNRAAEGLRVAEDIVRFSWNSARHALILKKLRHNMYAAFGTMKIPYDECLSTRDSDYDIGKKSVEKKDAISLESLFIANMKRAQEALRVLEECSKAYSYRSAALFQSIRFDAYSVEKKVIAAR